MGETSDREDAPRTDVDPGDIPRPAWTAVLKRTMKEFQADQLTSWAASLTYYAVLALFPGLLVLVALVGLLGQYPQTTDALVGIIRDITHNQNLSSVQHTIDNIVRNKGGAGALLGAGIVGSLWSASGYLGAFMNASNEIYDVEEGRPFVKRRATQVGVTLVLTVLLALVLIGFVATGSVASAISNQIGIGDTGLTIYEIAKWPAMALAGIFMLAILYYVGPNLKLPKFRWITPGAVVALLVWAAASFLFGLYVANFGSYNKTYGALGGAVSLLVWMWITNVAILFGHELNAEIERGRELAAGKPAVEEFALEPRGEPKDPEGEAEEVSREARFQRGDGNGGSNREAAIDSLGRDGDQPGGESAEARRGDSTAH